MAQRRVTPEGKALLPSHDHSGASIRIDQAVHRLPNVQPARRGKGHWQMEPCFPSYQSAPDPPPGLVGRVPLNQ